MRPKHPVLEPNIVSVVDKLGPNTSGFSIGDRVMGDLVMVRGGFAQYACVSVAEMIRVPDGLSDEIAACLPQAGGGSGTMALQLAKAAGAHVTAVDNASKIDWLRSLGADEVIDYREQGFARTGQQWDRILDMVATRGPAKIATALSRGGIYRALG
jgi:NADPH:quinone reductase-like Zn-dependent oxidoreductase